MMSPPASWASGPKNSIKLQPRLTALIGIGLGAMIATGLGLGRMLTQIGARDGNNMAIPSNPHNPYWQSCDLACQHPNKNLCSRF